MTAQIISLADVRASRRRKADARATADWLSAWAGFWFWGW